MSLLHPAVYGNKSATRKILYAVLIWGFPALLIYWGFSIFIYGDETATFRLQFLSANLILALFIGLIFTYTTDVRLWIIRTDRPPLVMVYAWILGGFLIFFGLILVLAAENGLVAGLVTIFLGLILVLIGFFSKEVKTLVITNPLVKNSLTVLGILACIALLIAIAYATVPQYGIILGVILLVIVARLAAR